MLGFPLLYFKGMRLLMFQLSGFYYRPHGVWERLGGSRALGTLKSNTGLELVTTTGEILL